MESSSERSMKADVNSLGIMRGLDKLTGGAFDLDSLDASTSGSKKRVATRSSAVSIVAVLLVKSVVSS